MNTTTSSTTHRTEENEKTSTYHSLCCSWSRRSFLIVLLGVVIMVGGLGALTSIAAGLPIGLAGGAGYGFGIRYGFEELFPEFTQNGAIGAAGKIASDLGELVQNIFNLGDANGQPSPPPTTDDTPLQDFEDILPPQHTDTNDPHEEQGPQLPDNVPVDPHDKISITVHPEGFPPETFIRTEQGHYDRIQQMYFTLQNYTDPNVLGPEDRHAITQRLIEYQEQFHSYFGYYVPPPDTI